MSKYADKLEAITVFCIFLFAFLPGDDITNFTVLCLCLIVIHLFAIVQILEKIYEEVKKK